MICAHSGALFSHEKKWSTDTCYNLGEPWKHCAKWFHLYEMSNIGMSVEIASRLVVVKRWGRGEKGMTADGCRAFGW